MIGVGLGDYVNAANYLASISGSYVQVIAYSFYSIHSMFLFYFLLSNLEILFVSAISPFLVKNVTKSEVFVCTNSKIP